jgi:uncharacterized membrane protein YdjX (TVP38/TMEM64 family)
LGSQVYLNPIAERGKCNFNDGMKFKERIGKWILLFFLISIPYFFLRGRININQWQDLYSTLKTFSSDHPVYSGLGFIFFYLINSSFNLPFALYLTLGSGILFGFSYGFLLSSFSSTLGALFGFFLARMYYREDLILLHRESLEKVQKMILRNDRETILTLRIVPIFPYFLVNILLGLTNIKWEIFLIYSWIGMIPGTCLIVWSGTSLARIQNISDILSGEILVLFGIMGTLPWVVKSIYAKWLRKN